MTLTTIDDHAQDRGPPGPPEADRPPRRPHRDAAARPDARPQRQGGARPWTRVPVDAVALGFLAFAVLAFSRAWAGGELVLDGPGASLWLDISLDDWRTGGIEPWLPELWAGTPGWAVAPTFPVLSLVPLAALVGPARAVQLATLAFQVLGAWGTYALARSLWSQRAPALLAGLVYGLHPLLVAHAALAGNEPALGVMAATPWLVWATRRALRAGTSRTIALAGLIAGLAVLQQPEHAYGLVLLIACLLAVEVARARTAKGTVGPAALTVRAAAIGALSVGVVAYWFLPFTALSRNFVLTPLNAVRDTLIDGVGGMIGREPGLLLARSAGLAGSVSFENTDFIAAGGFYLGWTCLAAVAVTLVLLPRRDRDGTLTAILFASAIALWMQTGGIPLASSGLARDVDVVPLAVIGAVAGLLVGSFLRRLAVGPGAVVGGVLTGGFLVALPYLAPFVTLQRVVPLLESIRFPRLYPIAVLGLALASAYPLTVLAPRVGRWAGGAWRRSSPLMAFSAAVAAAGIFLVDAHPYRSLYDVSPPPDNGAYDRAKLRLDNFGETGYRLASTLEPRPVESWTTRDVPLATGWPHPVASRHVWRLTTEALFAAPRELREPALGLAGARYTAYEVSTDRTAPGAVIDEVFLERNPSALPLVRAYRSTLVVADGRAPDLAPDLAMALGPRNIGVVAAGTSPGPGSGPSTAGDPLPMADQWVVTSSDPCEPVELSVLSSALAAELAEACSRHPWVGVITGRTTSNVAGGVGGVFTAPLDRLQGIQVWVDRVDPGLVLELYELGADGLALDRQVATASPASRDFAVEDLTTFRFAEPIADAGGRRYLFLLSCSRCIAGEEPTLVNADAERTSGTLVTSGRIRRDRVAAFTLVYGGLEAAEPATTSLSSTRPGPGRWTVEATGDHPALVVVAESWFPGWKATVDGEPAPVVRADGAFLGVAVGPGSHRIELEYHEPTVAGAGRAVSVATLALIAFMLAAPRRFRWLPRMARRPRPAPTPLLDAGLVPQAATAGAAPVPGPAPPLTIGRATIALRQPPAPPTRAPQPPTRAPQPPTRAPRPPTPAPQGPQANGSDRDLPR